MTHASKAENARAWYKDGLSFTCTQCGHCCKIKGFVWVDLAEVRAIAGYLKMDEKQFAKTYLRNVNGHVSLTEKPNHECIFWDKGCTIYPVRPTQCRTFPFWPQQLRSAENWRKASQECPGMDQGRKYSLKEIEQLRTGQGQTGRAKEFRDDK